MQVVYAFINHKCSQSVPACRAFLCRPKGFPSGIAGRRHLPARFYCKNQKFWPQSLLLNQRLGASMPSELDISPRMSCVSRNLGPFPLSPYPSNT